MNRHAARPWVLPIYPARLPDPHLIAVAAYAQTLRDLGVPRWQAAQRASRAIPRTHAQPRIPPTRPLPTLEHTR